MANENKIAKDILTIRDCCENGTYKCPTPIREYIKKEYPEATSDETFRNWLDNRWCKYENIPCYDDFRVLEESLLKFYEPIEIKIDTDILTDWCNKLEKLNPSNELLDEMKKILCDALE